MATVITKHLKNIFDTSEVVEVAVCAKIAHTADDGKNYKTNFYSLDAIIAVDYRVNSLKATTVSRISLRRASRRYRVRGAGGSDTDATGARLGCRGRL